MASTDPAPRLWVSEDAQIGELVAGFDAVANLRIPYGKLPPRARSLYASRYTTWSDIAETTVADSATNTTYNIWGLDLDGTLQGAGGDGGLLAVVKDAAT